MASSNPEKKSFFGRIKRFFYEKQRTIFKFLLVAAIALAAFALLTLISQVVTGDMGILKMFVNTFKYIGTESLQN